MTDGIHDDRHLIPPALPEAPGVTLDRKDQSTHQSGSSKHRLTREMAARGEAGSIVTLICDAGERYHDTWFAPGWVAAQGLDEHATVQDSRRRPDAAPATPSAIPSAAHSPTPSPTPPAPSAGVGQSSA